VHTSSSAAQSPPLVVSPPSSLQSHSSKRKHSFLDDDLETPSDNDYRLGFEFEGGSEKDQGSRESVERDDDDDDEMPGIAEPGVYSCFSFSLIDYRLICY
jgi:hypothetical protein